MKITDYGKWTTYISPTTPIGTKDPKTLYLKGHQTTQQMENLGIGYFSHITNGSIDMMFSDTTTGWTKSSGKPTTTL